MLYAISMWIINTDNNILAGLKKQITVRKASECDVLSMSAHLRGGKNHSTTSSRSVRSVKMSATGSSGCGPGPGPSSGTGSGASNPRKFSEKIALHTQRQAEETAAFQEVMMDITSTRVSEGETAARGAQLPGGREALSGLVTENLPYMWWLFVDQLWGNILSK